MSEGRLQRTRDVYPPCAICGHQFAVVGELCADCARNRVVGTVHWVDPYLDSDAAFVWDSADQALKARTVDVPITPAHAAWCDREYETARKVPPREPSEDELWGV